jgi:hypothetical protein
MQDDDASALREALRGFQVDNSRWQQPSDLSDVAIEVYLLTLRGVCLTRNLDARFGRANVEVARRQLGAWQLILDYRTTSGRALAALPPVPAWTARAADFTWTVHATPDLLHDLDDTGNPVVDIARAVCREIGALASKLWAVESGPSLRHKTRLSNGGRIAAALSLLFDQAEDEVLAMSRGPRLPQLALVWEAIERGLLEDNFVYRRLVMIDELVEHGLAIVRRDVVKAGVDLRVGGERLVDATYYVFDDDLVVRHEAEAGEISTYRREVNGLRQKHETACARALPALVVVANLQARANRLRERAGAISPDATFVFDRRVANGKFALKRPGWSDERFQLAEAALEDGGLLHRTAEGWSLPNYDVRFEDVDPSVGTDEICDICWCTGTSCICGADDGA